MNEQVGIVRVWELEAALRDARQVIVVACGTTAPYIKIALRNIDRALAGEPPPEPEERSDADA